MGKNTRYFRQSKSSLSGSQSAQVYNQVQREQPWHKRIWNIIKVRGKEESYGQS